LELRPPRGFRDVPPELAILRKEIISRLEAVYRRYGFDPLETPAVEHWEVWRASTARRRSRGSSGGSRTPGATGSTPSGTT